jgi:hypothetical protein
MANFNHDDLLNPHIMRPPPQNPPSNPYVGDMYADTTQNPAVAKIWDGHQWADLGEPKEKEADFTLNIKGVDISIPVGSAFSSDINLVCSMIDINGYPMYKSLKNNGVFIPYDKYILQQFLKALLQVEENSEYKNEITRELLEGI